jgi:hypothetical protein
MTYLKLQQKNLSNRFSASNSYHFFNSTTGKAFNNIKNQPNHDHQNFSTKILIHIAFIGVIKQHLPTT